MVEHRGVGMSRHDDAGADLPPEALTVDQVVDDIAAVLDDAHVESAVVYGTSYGTYIAAGCRRAPSRPGARDGPRFAAAVAARHRGRAQRDPPAVADGRQPRNRRVGTQSAQTRRRGSDDAVGRPGRRRQSTATAAPTCSSANSTCCSRAESCCGGRIVPVLTLSKLPYRYEEDLVSRIAFRELDYAAEPDGCRSTPPSRNANAHADGNFEAEPYDLVAEMPNFGWPTVVVSGGRDLITPPAVADGSPRWCQRGALEAAHHGAQRARLREPAALAIARAVWRGELDGLAAKAPRSTRFRRALRSACCGRRSGWPPPSRAPCGAAPGAAVAPAQARMNPMAV